MHVDEILELENYFSTPSVIIYSDEYCKEGCLEIKWSQVLPQIVLVIRVKLYLQKERSDDHHLNQVIKLSGKIWDYYLPMWCSKM